MSSLEINRLFVSDFPVWTVVLPRSHLLYPSSGSFKNSQSHEIVNSLPVLNDTSCGHLYTIDAKMDQSIDKAPQNNLFNLLESATRAIYNHLQFDETDGPSVRQIKTLTTELLLREELDERNDALATAMVPQRVKSNGLNRELLGKICRCKTIMMHVI